MTHFNASKFIIISGYVNSAYPIARVVHVLHEYSFNRIYLVNHKSFLRPLSKNGLRKLYSALLCNINSVFYILLALLLRKDIIFAAPAKINPIVIVLLFLSKRLYWLHMDNSYFCKSEYNFNTANLEECLSCIEDKKYAELYNCNNPKSNLLYPFYKLIYSYMLSDYRKVCHIFQSNQSLALFKRYVGARFNQYDTHVSYLYSSDYLVNLCPQ